MAQINARQIIATRLVTEFKKRGLRAGDLASQAQLSEGLVLAYLDAKRAISMGELFNLCEAAGINFYRLISKNYSSTNLHFRNVSKMAREAALEVEDIFLIIKDILPKAKLPNIHYPKDVHTDPQFLIAALHPIIELVRRQCGMTIEKIVEDHHITIFPIHRKDVDFDAFLLCDPPQFAICVNMAHVPGRIHFSLLHELAHLLFDRQSDIEVDCLPGSLYADQIDEATRSEYLATKFAQFFLVPFDEAEELSLRLPRIDHDHVRQVVTEHRTTVHVVCNAIYDLAQIRRRGARVSYKALRSDLERVNTPPNTSIRDFLNIKHKELASLVQRNSSRFSESVMSRINKVLAFDASYVQ